MAAPFGGDADHDTALAKALNPFPEQGNLMWESASVSRISGVMDNSWDRIEAAMPRLSASALSTRV